MLTSVSQQRALPAKKDNNLLGCVDCSPASRPWEVVVPLYYLALCPVLGSQYRPDISNTERVQHSATKMVKGLEHMPCAGEAEGTELLRCEDLRGLCSSVSSPPQSPPRRQSQAPHSGASWDGKR